MPVPSRSRLYDALAAMQPATFEILVCDALSEMLDLRVLRAKSGYQAGRDGSARDLMVECKHYPKSRLSDRELVGELHAAHADGCDLWVLAACCEVSEQTTRKLEQAAETLGLIVTVLDWPDGQPSRLRTLLEGAPRVVQRSLGLRIATRSGQAGDDRRKAIQRLRLELDTPLLSVERLRARLYGRLTDALADAGALGRDFCARPPEPPPGRREWDGFVERKAISEALTEWWSGKGAAEGQPAILLGDEGVGKSLAALRWLHSRAEHGDLVIPISANIPMTTDDPFDVLAGAAKRLFGDTEGRWRKRLTAFFSRSQETGLRTLIYLDGLNERPDAPWTGLLRALQSQPFTGQVGVLLSCRPWPFDQRFGRLAMIPKSPTAISVGLFDDAELGEALALHGRRLSEFPVEMRVLLGRPRLLAMALRNETRLRAAGEYTPTRLFWEDWRDRVIADRQIISDLQFRRALIELAKALDREDRTSLRANPLDLAAAIDRTQFAARDEGVREQTFSEIIDGGLAHLDSDLTLHLDPLFAALALGLELRFILTESHRRGVSGYFDLKDQAKALIEPWGGADFGAAVARFAAWACCEMAGTATVVRAAILALWLQEQNFGPSHTADATAVIRRDAGPAFMAADDLWFGTHGNGGLVLQRAFAGALDSNHDGGATRRLMIARVRAWAGRISLGRQVTGMTAKSVEEQQSIALEHFSRLFGRALVIGEEEILFNETLQLVRSRAEDGDSAGTLGFDALAATGVDDLGPILRTVAVSSVIDMDEDLAEACIRMVRRLGAEHRSFLDQLLGMLAAFRADGHPLAAEVADSLAFILDQPREPTVGGVHPMVEAFWPFVSPIYAHRFADPRYRFSRDDHLAQEGLLEADANLCDTALDRAAEYTVSGDDDRSLNFGVAIDAALARGLVYAPGRPATSPLRQPNRYSEPAPSAPAAPNAAEVSGAFARALLTAEAVDGAAALDMLFDNPANRAALEPCRLQATTGVKFDGGRSVGFARDERALSGRWIAEVFGADSQGFTGPVSRLVTDRLDIFEAHAQARPGLLFGVAQGAFLLGDRHAERIWELLEKSWQDFTLLPDQRYWYFDLPFEATETPLVLRLRDRALAAASNEAELLNIVLSALRWDRRNWLQDRIREDQSSDCAWRVARGTILAGMWSDVPLVRPQSNPTLAPTWLDEVEVAGFRYVRRRGRMRHWLAVLEGAPRDSMADAAMRVLLTDADRRLFTLGFSKPLVAHRALLLDHLTAELEGRDVYALSGGFLQHFLGIPAHPWLGPPGLPDTPYR